MTRFQRAMREAFQNLRQDAVEIKRKAMRNAIEIKSPEPRRTEEQHVALAYQYGWIAGLRTKYSSDDMARITRYVGCAPALGFLSFTSLEAILDYLDQASRTTELSDWARKLRTPE